MASSPGEGALLEFLLPHALNEIIGKAWDTVFPKEGNGGKALLVYHSPVIRAGKLAKVTAPNRFMLLHQGKDLIGQRPLLLGKGGKAFAFARQRPRGAGLFTGAAMQAPSGLLLGELRAWRPIGKDLPQKEEGADRATHVANACARAQDGVCNARWVFDGQKGRLFGVACRDSGVLCDGVGGDENNGNGERYRVVGVGGRRRDGLSFYTRYH